MEIIKCINVEEENDISPDIPEDISKIFPGVKLELIKTGPTGSQIPTNYIIRVSKISNGGETTSCVIKYFTPEAAQDGENQSKMQGEFNYFTTPGEFKNSNNGEKISGAKIRRKGNTPAGGFFYEMEDLNESMEKVYCAEETIDYLINLWEQYRGVFDRFEKYSGGNVTTKSNQIVQRLFSILQPKTSIESNPQTQKICNGVKKALLSLLKPVSKRAIKKKYFNNVNHRISNGGNTVKGYVEFNIEEINNCLKELLSKVKNFDFEYNFGRLWTDHIFLNDKGLKIIDFDNVGYQIKGTELIGLMRSNLLLSTRKYDSYGERKKDYDERYKKLVNIYKDENLVRCLLFSKLIGTIFQDNGYLIYEREIGGGNKERKNGIEEEKEMMNVKLKEEIELGEGEIEAKDLLEGLPEGGEAEFVDKKGIDVQKKSKQLVAINIAIGKKNKRIEVIVEVGEKVKLKEKNKLEEIKKGITWNYEALQELMDYTISQESKAA